jgi:hypothetical protein
MAAASPSTIAKLMQLSGVVCVVAEHVKNFKLTEGEGLCLVLPVRSTCSNRGSGHEKVQGRKTGDYIKRPV